MYGAILGDIIGSPYEFDRGNKTKEFPLFSRHSEFTDDTVMTLAVADAFMKVLNGRKCCISDLDEDDLKEKLIEKMQDYGRRYPYAGYGGNFAYWLEDENPEPYNSFGNGSAMRVSSVAWLFDDIISVVNAARISAEVTHNHRVLQFFVGVHQTLDTEDDKFVIGDVGVTVKEFTLRALAHGVDAKADFTEKIFREQRLASFLVLVVLGFRQIIEIGHNRIVGGLQFAVVRAVRDAELLIEPCHKDFKCINMSIGEILVCAEEVLEIRDVL